MSRDRIDPRTALRPVALGLAILLSLCVLSPRAEEVARLSTRFVLDDAGHIYAWNPGADHLEDRTSQILEPLMPGSVKDLAPLSDGRLVLIASGERQAGSKRGSNGQRGEGRAIVLDVSGPGTKVLHEIPFEGAGYEAAVTQGTTRVFVLAQHLVAGGAPNSGRAWIHAIDPDAGRIVDSTGLLAPVLGLAVDPRGRRVFASREDRIMTCTTNPLLNSWFYRSPGVNGDLAFRPGTEILLALRGREMALFDPLEIAGRTEAERHGRTDDATAVVQLEFPATELAVSEDGHLAAALGGRFVPFSDLDARTALRSPDLGETVRRARFFTPLAFRAAPEGLSLGLFPEGAVARIPGPASAPAPKIALAPGPEPMPAPVPEPTRAVQPPGAAPSEIRSAPPEPPADADPRPPPAPMPPVAAPRSRAIPQVPAATPAATEEAVLRGRVTDSRHLTAAIVIYGPDSIVREWGRARPGDDGSWDAPLPPPGTYRLVPEAEGTRPLRSSPNFHTVVVRTRQGW